MNFVNQIWDFEMLGGMFRLCLPFAEKISRPILVYGFLVVALRIFGKRELAQLNPFDLIVLLMLSNTVQNAIIGNDISVTGGIIGAVTLLATNYFVVRFVLKYEVNLEAELEILSLHEKLDELREWKWKELIQMEQEQMELLIQLVKERDAQVPE